MATSGAESTSRGAKEGCRLRGLSIAGGTFGLSWLHLAAASEELLDVITTTKRGADESKTSEVKRLSPQQFLAVSVPT